MSMFQGLYAGLESQQDSGLQQKVRRAADALQRGVVTRQQLLEALEIEMQTVESTVEQTQHSSLGDAMVAACETYFASLEHFVHLLSSDAELDPESMQAIYTLAQEADRQMQNLSE